MSAKRRAGLKLALAASLALALSAAVLYEAVYLPFRESRLAEERLREREQAEARKRAEAMRLLAQQQDADQRQAAQNAAAQARYQNCFGAATAAHDSAWATECKRRADQIRQNHDDCLTQLKLPPTYCDTSYVPGDASPNCVLPGGIATVIDADLERARNRCLRESQAAQQ